MNLWRPVPGCLIAAVFIACGCNHSRDITKSQAARDSGLLGKCYAFRQDMILLRQSNPNRLSVMPGVPNYEADGAIGAKRLELISRGTRVRVTKVIEFNHGLAMAPSDLHFTFGRIENGPFAGRVVELNAAGVQILPNFHPGPAYVDLSLVAPCE